MSQLKNIAALAVSLIAVSACATHTPAEKKCGASACGKKEATAPAPEGKQAACAKKEAACGKKDAPKDAACGKKEAACGKK